MEYANRPSELELARAELAQDDKSADNWNRLAIAQIKEGELAQAVDSIGRAIELQPADATNYNNRGRLLFALERVPESLTDYTKALELEPSAELYAARSVVNLALGKEAAALSDLNDAYDLQPSVENLLNRASFFSNKGMAADALRDMTEVIKLAPDNPEYRLSRANLAFALAQYDPALNELGLSDIERAIELDQNGAMQPTFLKLADLLEASLDQSPNPTIVRRLIALIRKGDKGSSGVGDH